MKLTLPSMVVLTALEMIVVSGTPIDTGIPDISRTLDCKVFDTPESCNTFCAAVFCFGHKDVM